MFNNIDSLSVNLFLYVHIMLHYLIVLLKDIKNIFATAVIAVMIY